MVKQFRLQQIDLNLPPFVPFLPFWTGHSQTLLAHLIPMKTQNRDWQSEIISLADDDSLLVQFIDQGSDTTLSVYHGLSGSSSSDYMRRTAELGLQRGWNVVLVNHRAVDESARSEKSYHSGRGADASDVISWCRQKFENSRQLAVGFSMSGSILLNLLTGKSGTVKPDYAVVINSPLNLANASRRLKQGFSRVYDWRFYLRLKKLIQKRDSIAMPFLGTTWDVDELYTSQKNGFSNALDYYQRCSTQADVNKITTYTFVLSTYDDPFIDVHDYLTAQWNEYTHVTLLKSGGHMGYFNRWSHPVYQHRWMDVYLNQVFSELQKIF